LERLTLSLPGQAVFTVRGLVQDEEGLPLIGATVREVGTTTGVITDFEGRYEISVTDENASLQFSYTGYVTQTVAVKGNPDLAVTLEEDYAQLEEVVVVGYGAQRKQDLTGAVAVIDEEALEKMPVSSINQALQGRSPGVRVTQASGAPGGAISIRIRGASSIAGSNEPLFVVDGVPLNGVDANAGGGGRQNAGVNPLAAINPSDIESIQILKDASATAIYGSRASNGVVLITTKRGKAGQNVVTFDAFAGVSEVIRRVDLIEGGDFARFRNAALEATGEPPFYTDEQIAELERTGGTDWQDEIFDGGSVQSYNLGFSGGNQQTKYALSFNYFNEDGTIRTSGFDRYSARLNLDQELSDKLSIGGGFFASRTNYDIVPTDGGNTQRSGIIFDALNAGPATPVFQEDGSYNEETIEAGGNFSNPVAVLDQSDDNIVATRLLLNTFLNYEILENLSFRTTLGYDTDSRTRETYFGQLSPPNFGGNVGGLARTNTRNASQVLNTNTLNWRPALGTNKTMLLTVGHELQYNENTGYNAENSAFLNDVIGVPGIGSGTNVPSVGAFRGERSLLSFFGRAVFNLNEKYLVTATGRYDGSSVLSEGNRWNFFPSVALAYRLGQEAFMQRMDGIDDFKIRLGYGVTGSQNIPGGRSVNNVSAGGLTTFGGSNPVVQPEVALSRLGNPTLTWERTGQYNVGLDLSFFSGRLRFTGDYYEKQTDDLLINVFPPASFGVNQPSLANLGRVDNYGAEFSLGGDPFVGKFAWRIEGNLGFNRNEVIDIGERDQIVNTLSTAGGRPLQTFILPGEPLGIFFGYQTDGIFRTEAEAENHADQSLFYRNGVGDKRYVDQNGDGVINTDDRVVLGSPIPDFTFGIYNEFSYADFTLSMFFQGVQGGSIFNWMNLQLINPGANNSIYQVTYDEAFGPNNPGGSLPSFNDGASGADFDDYLLEDASYFRLQNVNLAYNLPAGSIEWLRNAQVYISAQNVFTITDYRGYDPDVNSYGSNNSIQGVDGGAYPTSKTYTLGLKVSL
jgi:TonB-linked SusC/RagA family outer membrane protein